MMHLVIAIAITQTELATRAIVPIRISLLSMVMCPRHLTMKENKPKSMAYKAPRVLKIYHRTVSLRKALRMNSAIWHKIQTALSTVKKSTCIDTMLAR